MKRGRIIPGRNPQQKKTNSSSSSKKSSYTAMNPRTGKPITTNKKSTAKAGDNVSKSKLGVKESTSKNYNVGASKGGVSFGEAFKHFRNQGAKEFTWNGKKYHTKTKEEM
jgi:hypothetical protein